MSSKSGHICRRKKIKTENLEENCEKHENRFIAILLIFLVTLKNSANKSSRSFNYQQLSYLIVLNHMDCFSRKCTNPRFTLFFLNNLFGV